MNRIGKVISLSAGLALACIANSAQTTTNVLSETTFDAAAPSPWSYGYYYGDGGAGYYTHNRAFYFPEDVDMTNAVYQYTFDASGLVDMSSWGTGTGAPLFRADTDPTLFTSGDRADYIISFDARAVGLLEGQATGNAEMQIQLYRKDENNADQKFLHVNIAFALEEEWKTFTFSLADGGLGDGTLDADLAAHRAEVSDIRFNVNLHEPFRAFGYDGDNEFYLDNVKLAVINRSIIAPTPTYTQPIIDWNMDDKPAWSQWNFDWTQNNVHALFVGGNAAGSNTEGVDASTAWYLSMDNTAFNDAKPDWAGGGSGGNGPADYTLFDSGDLAMYQVSFDARVAGLAEGKLDTTTVLQLHIDVADDTLAVDEDTDSEFLGRFDFQIGRVSPTWQRYTFLLSKAAAPATAKENFAAHSSKINAVRTQWQIENAASLADWGFDADNVLYIDNIKLERIFEGLGALSFAPEGTELVLSWTNAASGTTTLQQADDVEGPYSDVVTTGSTHRATMDAARKFYRLNWTAPAP